MSNQIVLVTGASGGIGQAIVGRFLADGACVVAADRASSSLQPSDRLLEIVLDVTSEDAWRAALAQTRDRFGPLSVLVNNAGIISYAPAHEETLESWERMVAVNQTGVMLGMKHALNAMLQAGAGSIVNVSSTLGLVAMPGALAYHATKAAVATMTLNAAITYARQNIRVNAVLPGITDTALVHRQDPSFTQGGIDATPMGRLGRPEEIANAIFFLASSQASFITGSLLPVDGGYLAQ